MAKDFKIHTLTNQGQATTSYTLDHTAASFFNDPQGRPRLYARYGAGAEASASDAKLPFGGSVMQASSNESTPNRRRRWMVALGLPAAAGLGLFTYLHSNRPARGSGSSDLPLVMRAQPLPLPDLRVLDGKGRPVDLSSFRGKMVLLNIWATWCPPCREEMPSLDRLQAQLGGDEFQVVALSMDAGAKALDQVKSFYASVGIKHLAVFLDADAAAIFTLKAVSVPTTLLLDRQGRELGRMSGTAEWDSPRIVKALRELLGAQAR
ncbi:MAG: TlpA disulfide reductase family protein [Pseudomonadota bacterium]|uniref:TlpA family protein disulfide reductase n=1 Tax=Hydrogenophaga sp. TaxID=1904254 RepID=UPI00335053BF